MKTTSTIAVAAVILLGLPQAAMANWCGVPQISAVVVNEVDSQIDIFGSCLPNWVWQTRLADETGQFVNADTTQWLDGSHVQATFTPLPPPGDYKMLLKRQGAILSMDWQLTIGAVGPEGPQGIEGPQGPMGPPGLSQYSIQEGACSFGTALVDRDCSVTCPAGTRVLGGGVSNNHAGLGREVRESFPRDNGWHATITGGAAFSGTIYAICAAVDDPA